MRHVTDLRMGVAALLALTLTACASAPHVVSSTPGDGAVVPAGTGEISVSFDRPMLDGSWSWIMETPDTFPKYVGDPYRSEDGRTFVLPVRLEPGKEYVIWINRDRGRDHFRGEDGRSAEPLRFRFRTEPAAAESE